MKKLSEKSNLPVFVLAGGFGTRLRSVVSDVPKTLAPIAEKPFLHYLLKNLIDHGLSEFIFLLYYEADQIIDYVENSDIRVKFPELKIQYIIEPEPLGTGGAIKYALERYPVEENFLVVNSDTWLSDGIGEMSVSEAPCVATVTVPNVSRYGGVVCKDGWVLGFSEKNETDQGGEINAGIYLFSTESFEQCAAEKFSIEGTILPELVAERKLRAVHLDCFFIDIGIPEDYQTFCKWVRP